MTLTAGWRAWERAEPVARWLVLAGAAALFLSAAATVHIVYTIPPSLALLSLAAVVGAPAVLRGWLRLPAYVGLAAAALLLAFLVAFALDHPTVLPGQPRTGGYRAALYVALLCVGLANFGLVAGLWRDIRDALPLVVALAAGAGVAGLYALYQWPAQHFGLPLANINNTLDSNGITQGVFQGAGILGWERVRGTFIEPHFLASYLSTMLPLPIGLALAARGVRRALAAVAAAAAAGGLVVTSSAPPVVLCVLAVMAAVVAAAVARGLARTAAVTGTLLAVALIVTPAALARPGLLTSVTGRSAHELAKTVSFRTNTWSRVVRIWEQRPGLGYGPGQSSVQLAAMTDAPADRRPATPGALQSAQGVWAAALVDAGIAGFGAWVVLAGAALAAIAGAVAARASYVGAAAFAAAVAAVANSEMTGDRVELSAWLVLGLGLLAAARGSAERRTDQSDDQPDPRAGEDVANHSALRP